MDVPQLFLPPLISQSDRSKGGINQFSILPLSHRQGPPQDAVHGAAESCSMANRKLPPLQPQFIPNPATARNWHPDTHAAPPSPPPRILSELSKGTAPLPLPKAAPTLDRASDTQSAPPSQISRVPPSILSELSKGTTPLPLPLPKVAPTLDWASDAQSAPPSQNSWVPPSQTNPAQHSASSSQPQSSFRPFSIADRPAPPTTASSGGTGGCVYQMMALDTENGPIQVPVEVEAASKIADEKRKRNARASHRFRQHRLEKARETSEKIAELEQEVRDMREERDFYRSERDYFQNVASKAMVGTHPQSQMCETGDVDGQNNKRRRRENLWKLPTPPLEWAM